VPRKKKKCSNRSISQEEEDRPECEQRGGCFAKMEEASGPQDKKPTTNVDRGGGNLYGNRENWCQLAQQFSRPTSPKKEISSEKTGNQVQKQKMTSDTPGVHGAD